MKKTEYVVTREYGEQDFGVIFLHFLKTTCQKEDIADHCIWQDVEPVKLIEK